MRLEEVLTVSIYVDLDSDEYVARSTAPDGEHRGATAHVAVAGLLLKLAREADVPREIYRA